MCFRWPSCSLREANWRNTLVLSLYICEARPCSRSVFKSVDQYDVVTYVDASFLKIFLWERSGALSTMLVEFKAVKPKKIIVDEVEMEKTSIINL